ncbi:copper homeostasis periplasmic binding protein CopC [Serratia sp. M24T3]|uniref:copper homeostasis periplasmic binding protein CopC n=1 Tax=Serratia sp. M24T3 TaxID=932213 RepID=UPI00025B905A|nr:copper homeostasis periplasmic binding protein CopC [Serratia sp. M24T3]EIC85423.1 copper resistance protein CopC [Serratia sp. M24T3]
MSIKKLKSLRILSSACVLAAGLISQQAFAHAHLKTETPAADSQISVAPTELTLGFSEGVEPNFSKIELRGPDNKSVKTGDFKLAAKDNTQVLIALPTPLTSGKYLVSWHVVSVDGHKTQGEYSFTVK